MVRVLHLSSVQPDFQAERGMAAIAHALGDDFQIEKRAIGRGGDWRNGPLAWLALRRDQSQTGRIIHAWDETGLMAALASGRSAIVYSPSALPGRRALGRLHWAMQFRNVRVVVQSEAERAAAIAGGIDAGRCEVIAPTGGLARKLVASESGKVSTSADGPSPQPSPPGTREREQEISASARGRVSRAEVRARLGFGEEDFVLLPPGESTRLSGHRESLWAGSILHVLDQRYKVLLWGRGELADACRQLAGKLHQPALAVIAEAVPGRRVEYEELAWAADAVLFAPRGPVPLLAVKIAMQAGLPVVATPSRWIGEELKRGGNWVEVERYSPRVLGQRVMKLRAEHGSRIAMQNNLTAHEQFLDEYRRLYRSR